MNRSLLYKNGGFVSLIGVIVVALVLTFSAIKIQEGREKSAEIQDNKNLAELPAASPMPTLQSSVTSKTNSLPIKSDPIINCTFKHKGAISMLKSQCVVSFECPIDKNYFIYTSSAKCIRDIKTYGQARIDALKSLISQRKIVSNTPVSTNYDGALQSRLEQSQKDYEDYKKMIETKTSTIDEQFKSFEEYLNEVGKHTSAYSDSVNQQLKQQNQHFYDLCVGNVQTKYQPYHINTTTQNKSIVDKYNDEIAQCGILYK